MAKYKVIDQMGRQWQKEAEFHSVDDAGFAHLHGAEGAASGPGNLVASYFRPVLVERENGTGS